MPNTFKFKGFQCEIPHAVIVAASVIALLLATAWTYLHYIHEDVVRVIIEHEDPSATLQTVESMRHLAEDPAFETRLDDQNLLIQHFDSDDCTLVLWQEEGEFSVPTFVIHPSRTFDQPEEIGAFSGFASVAYAGAGRCEGAPCGDPVRCHWDAPHPGRFEVYQEPYGPCFVRYWRRFEDCCEHWQEYNPCTDQWGSIFWTCCLH